MFDSVKEALDLAKKRFEYAASCCPFRTPGTVGLVNPKPVIMCAHENYDVDSNPAMLCLMGECPRLTK